MDTKQMTKVVQVEGLHFRFSRLRARRGLRGVASLIDLLGPGGAALITGADANGVSQSALTKAGGMSALMRLVAGAAFQAGKLHDPDTIERFANELLHFAASQGTQYSTDGESWVAVNGLATLDSFEMLDHMSVLDLLRHCVEFNFFPTSAGAAMSDATAPAAATTTRASGQPGESAGHQMSAPTGAVSG